MNVKNLVSNFTMFWSIRVINGIIESLNSQIRKLEESINNLQDRKRVNDESVQKKKESFDKFASVKINENKKLDGFIKN